MAPVAHISHWYTEILYVLPVVLVVAWLSFSAWRDRRRGEDADAADAPDRIA